MTQLKQGWEGKILRLGSKDMNNPKPYLKKLEKEEKFRSKISRREIVKVKTKKLKTEK